MQRLHLAGALLDSAVHDSATRQCYISFLTELNDAAQVLYLTSDEASISLRRQHTIVRPNVKPLEFSMSVDVTYVPPDATPLERWKHYVSRAFAARHILRLTLSAGTSDEGPAIKVCACFIEAFK